MCTVSFGVTGYSLPWDQVGYWAIKIVTGVPDAIPIIGPIFVTIFRGNIRIGKSTDSFFIVYIHLFC